MFAYRYGNSQHGVEISGRHKYIVGSGKKLCKEILCAGLSEASGDAYDFKVRRFFHDLFGFVYKAVVYRLLSWVVYDICSQKDVLDDTACNAYGKAGYNRCL